MTFKIVELEPSENRLILSHKAVVETEKEANKGKLMDELVAGDIVEGTVARLTNFGAFVDLGGVDGLVHISQIAHEHVKNPGDVLAIGQSVKVKILSIDKENGRVSLSIKDTLAGPWDAIAEKAPIGAVLTGVVKRLTSFGAFVEVFPGVEGLVHISQISHQHIATPHEVLQEGQEIQVKVLDAKEDEQRLSLSIKALEEKAANESTADDERKEKKENKDKKVEEYVADDSDGNFTLADLLGDKLSGLKDDSEA